MPNIYIITEGSKHIGFGHITRCTSLYEAFEEKKLKPVFVINGDTTVKKLLAGKRHLIFNWIKNPTKLVELLQDADIAVIDSYLANASLYKTIANTVKIPVYIDDNKRINYPAGIVVNGAVYAKELKHPKHNTVRYLLGCKYMPLRKAFWNVPEKKISKTLRSILITFGGDDIRGMTPKALRFLCKTYPMLTKHVVIGGAFRHVDRIEKIADTRTHLHYGLDATEMKKLMLRSDIAISAGGQTLYELARTGVPTIAVIVADNQINNVAGWLKNGFIKEAGVWNKSDIIHRIFEHMHSLSDPSVRKRMTAAGQRFVDGQGAKRTIEHILNFCYSEK